MAATKEHLVSPPATNTQKQAAEEGYCLNDCPGDFLEESCWRLLESECGFSWTFGQIRQSSYVLTTGATQRRHENLLPP